MKILDGYWKEPGTPNSKATDYFDEYILPKITNQLILVLEGMDRIFQYAHPLPLDFCGLLRGWHERSRREHDEQHWKKLSLITVYATDDYAILGMDVSPLANVGEAIILEDFTFEQVKELAQKYGLIVLDEKITELVGESNGHPFIVDLAMKTMNEKSIELNEILRTAATQEGIYSDHLREIWNVLRDNSCLAEAFKKVITFDLPVPLPPDTLFKLQSLGLIKVEGNGASPRCQIYKKYFYQNL